MTYDIIVQIYDNVALRYHRHYHIVGTNYDVEIQHSESAYYDVVVQDYDARGYIHAYVIVVTIGYYIIGHKIT